MRGISFLSSVYGICARSLANQKLVGNQIDQFIRRRAVEGLACLEVTHGPPVDLGVVFAIALSARLPPIQ